MTTCQWVFLRSLTTPKRLCGRYGYPYCPEHQRELDAMAKAKDWDEYFATLRPAGEGPKKERRLFVVRKGPPVTQSRPVGI